MKRVEDGDGALSLAPDDDENSLDDSWSRRRLGKHYLPNATYLRLYTHSPLLHRRHENESHCPELQLRDTEWSTRSHVSEISIDNNKSIEVGLGGRHIVKTDSC